MTVLLTTDDVDFAYHWADDLHLLADGRLGSFAAITLLEHAAVPAAAGHPLPAVIRLHQQLAARGQLASDVRPRSLDMLLGPACPDRRLCRRRPPMLIFACFSSRPQQACCAPRCLERNA